MAEILVAHVSVTSPDDFKISGPRICVYLRSGIMATIVPRSEI